MPLRPILFWSAWQLCLVLGSLFALGVFAVFAYTESFRQQPLALWQSGLVCAAGGALFGGVMAAIVRRRARRLGLSSSWASYRGG